MHFRAKGLSTTVLNSIYALCMASIITACGGGGGSNSKPTLSSSSSSSVVSSAPASSSSSSVVSSVVSSDATSSAISSVSSSATSSSSVESSVSSATSSNSSVGVSTLVPITVDGKNVKFGGEIASVAGPSLFWSNTGWGGEKYYNANVVSWVKQDWNAKLIRASMGVEENGGYIQSPAANKARVVSVVDAAIANNMYVIIDWHSHNAHNYKTEAIAFFQDMATTYGANPNVIYEIFNEPLNKYTDIGKTTSALVWSDVIKPYALDVIAAIRAIDPDNLIIVGTPTWSQDVDVAANSPITGYDNIAYTLHFYAATHKQFLRNKATTAMNKGIALFVTEWGSVEASGDGAVDTVETATWLDFLKTNNISHANWALNDKAEGASALTVGSSANGNWTDANLTTSGALVKEAIKNW